MAYYIDSHRQPQLWPWPRQPACSVVAPVVTEPGIVDNSTRDSLVHLAVADTRSYWSATVALGRIGSGAAEGAAVAGWAVER